MLQILSVVIRNVYMQLKLFMGGGGGWGGQNLERRNVERPIFWNFTIANIKITKDELFDNFIFEFIFFIF